MYNFLLNKLSESTNYLFDNFEGLFLFEFLSLDELFQIAMFAILCYYVETILGTQDVSELDNVLVIEPFE
jgi:hypothetical protein